MRAFLLLLFSLTTFAASPANRLTFVDEANPFYVHGAFPKLTTPQWIGESNINAVVTLGIDDMRDPAPYEKFLRPLLDRLKQIDGRAPVSIFSVAPTPTHPQLTNWLAEGLSFEVHTLTHPCPILAKSNFTAAATTLHSCIDLLSTIPGNAPVAFRTPCCDSINSASPRLFAELLCATAPSGKFLTMDSSVVMLFTENESNRFTKYVPFPSFKTTINDYPYPYVINQLLWEMPFAAPSDWESRNIQGDYHPQFVADWNRALEITLQKRGIFNTVFHPHGWSSSTQLIAFVNHAVQLGNVKFLTYPEVQSRINKNLLLNQPLRAPDGSDNGVRLLDLNNDGFLDVIIGNQNLRRTRLWNNSRREWIDSDFPTQIKSAHFGIVRNNLISMLTDQSAWTFHNSTWTEDRDLSKGLPPLPQHARLRDIDNDGSCELILSSETQNQIFAWDEQKRSWSLLPFALPKNTSIVNKDGLDNGLRFIDINEDGYDDILFSNEHRYSLHLYIPKLILGFDRGWTRQVSAGLRTDADAIPAIVRAGPHRNNGAWFHSKTLWVQNEDTAHLPDLVERRAFADLLVGKKPAAKSPQEALKSFILPEGFKIEAVATEPLVVDPVAFEWNARGDLYVVEMRDYPTGIPSASLSRQTGEGRGEGSSRGGGAIKLLRDTNRDGIYDTATEFLSNLNFPSGVMPWRDGILISAAPNIIFARDTNNDGKADSQIVLITGFTEGNQQHRFNGFEMGLDGWVYGANGDSGGNLKVLAGVLNRNGAPTNPIRLRGDFRFKPDTGELEAIEGTTQFGRRRDDWDNWFGNNNPNWLWHYYLPSRYIERNPTVRIADLRVITSPNNILYPPPNLQQRFNDIGKGNTASAANSPTPYRDDLFGPGFAQTVFISDPSFNLIHREILEPDGVTFKSHRHPADRDREFLASTDNWFRPTMLKTGPDGALYIADMYRFVLEHPEWIPKDVQQAMDLRAGSDKGRIYRLYPTNATLRPIPNLEKLSTRELIAALDTPNGWQRDTIQQLLLWRNEKPKIPPQKNPAARAQALWITRDKEQTLAALKDPDPRVRRQAIRLAEELNLTNAVAPLTRDPEVTVAFQAALTLGDWTHPTITQRLAPNRATNKPAPTQTFTITQTNRTQLLAEYSPISSLTGDPIRGRALYRQYCASCHRFGNDGSPVGPDLGSVAQKPLDYLLTAILDPNQAIEARYLTHEATTKDNEQFTGIKTAETANAITLTAANNFQQTYLRPELKDLKTSTRSLMPEGLESALPPQAMSDLLAYITSSAVKP